MGNYNGGTITTTTLADVVRSVASSAGVSISSIRYYDFEYPGANRMMMIVDWLPSAGYDSYQIKIPSSFVLNENSWSVRVKDYLWNWDDVTFQLDGNIFPNPDGTYFLQDYAVRYGSFSSIMSPDVFHNINSWANGYGIPAGVNTVLVYRQP